MCIWSFLDKQGHYSGTWCPIMVKVCMCSAFLSMNQAPQKLRPSDLHLQNPVKYGPKAPTWWSFGFDWSTGAWDMEQPPFCDFIKIGLYRGQGASITKILQWLCKKRWLSEVLVQNSQQGPLILSSLHFVMLHPYLGGQFTFGGHFFTGWALLHRSINICCQFGQKCLFRGLASMEVKWPPSSESC